MSIPASMNMNIYVHRYRLFLTLIYSKGVYFCARAESQHAVYIKINVYMHEYTYMCHFMNIDICIYMCMYIYVYFLLMYVFICKCISMCYFMNIDVCIYMCRRRVSAPHSNHSRLWQLAAWRTRQAR